MSELKAVTEVTFDAEVMKSDRAVLVDFWAEWCGPCKALAPTLAKLSDQFKDNVDFVKVNVDENASVRDRFGVRGIPTLLLLKGGAELGRVVGNRSATQLAGFIDNHLGTVTEMPAALAISLNAFGGEPLRKASRLNDLRAYIDRKKAAPSENMWEGPISDALQFVANATDIDDCARVLGIPVNVLIVVRSLSTYRNTNLNAAEYVAEWSESVPVAANLSRLPGRLLVDILRSEELTELLGEDSELYPILDQLALLHASSEGDEKQFEADLAGVKQKCEEIMTGLTDVYQASLCNMLTSVCQPLNDAAVMTDFIYAVAGAKWKLLRHECNWTSDDDRRWLELAEETSKSAIVRGEASPIGAGMTAKIAEIDPELARRFSYHYEEGTKVTSVTGRKIGERLIRLTQQYA